MDSIQQQRIAVENDITVNEKLLAEAQKRLEGREAVFYKRVRDIYINGRLSYLDVVIGSKDFTDFANRLEILKRIIDSDIKLIEEIKGTKEEAFLSRLTLRAMKRAQYTTVNTGHFGLATQYYCHFTSPIRRYPDLQIHRIIKENLRYGHSPKRIAHYESILPGVAKRCSDRERLADEAEREVDKMKKVEYMQAHIGEMYEGIISGVTSWGIYVELDNTVEGMIRLADMDDDQYEYQEEKYRVIGHYSGKEYSMGQTVKIRVIGADRLTRTIDFAIADNSPKDSE